MFSSPPRPIALSQTLLAAKQKPFAAGAHTGSERLSIAFTRHQDRSLA
jgi:hypothetical protein